MANRDTEVKSSAAEDDNDDDLLCEDLTESRILDSPRLEPIGLEDTGQSSYPERNVVGQEESGRISFGILHREPTQSFQLLPADCSSAADGREDLVGLASGGQTTAISEPKSKSKENKQSLFTVVVSEIIVSEQQSLENTDSLTQHRFSDISWTTGEPQNAKHTESLSQHRLSDTQVSNTTKSETLDQYPLDSVELASIQLTESGAQLSQHSLCTDDEKSCLFSQYTLEETKLSANGTLSKRSSTSSFQAIRETFCKSDDGKSSVIDKHDSSQSSTVKTSSSDEYSDPMAMFSTRPGTAVETVDCDQLHQCHVTSNSLGTSNGCENGISGAVNGSGIQHISADHAEGKSIKSQVDACSFQTVNSTQFRPESASTPEALSTASVGNKNQNNAKTSEKELVEEFAAMEEVIYPSLICAVTASDAESSELNSRPSSKGSRDEIFIADNGLFTAPRIDHSLTDDLANGATEMKVNSAEINQYILTNGHTQSDAVSSKSNSVSSTPVDVAGVLDVSCKTGDTDSLTAGYLECVGSTGDVGERSSFTTVTELELQSQTSSVEPQDPDAWSGKAEHKTENDKSKQGDNVQKSELKYGEELKYMDKSEHAGGIEYVRNNYDAESGTRHQSVEPGHRSYLSRTKPTEQPGRFIQISDDSEQFKTGHEGTQHEDPNDDRRSDKVKEHQASPGSLSDKVAALLAEVQLQPDDSPTGAGHCKDHDVDTVTEKAEESDDDIKRVTAEYRQALSSHISSSDSSLDNEDKYSSDDAGAISKTNGRVNEQDQKEIAKLASGSVRIGELKSSESDTDDTLDRDVKRILAKYGHMQSDSEDERATKVSSYYRSSAANSDVESDNISDRVKKLLCGKPDDRMETVNGLTSSSNLPLYLFDDPAKSMSLPVDLQSGVSEVSLSPKSADFRDGTHNVMSENTDSDDQLSTKVRQVLREGDNGTGSAAGGSSKGFVHSKSSSRTSSTTGSVSLDDLGKDINEIEMSLENLKKSSEKSSARSDQSKSECLSASTVSSKHGQLAELSERNNGVKLGHSDTEENGYLQYSRMEKESTETQNMPSGTKRQSEREMSSYGSSQQIITARVPVRSTVSSYVPKVNKTDLGTHMLLTSGVLPLDVALDIVHGYDYPTLTSGDESFRRQGYSGYHYPYTKGIQSRSPGMEHSDKPGYSKMAALDQAQKIDSEDAYRTNYSTDLAKNYLIRDKSVPSLPGREFNAKDSLHLGGTSADVQKNLDEKLSITPTTRAPISILSNVKNLFTSHMDKVVLSAFDKSVELRTPFRRHLESNINKMNNSSGILVDPDDAECSATPAVSAYPGGREFMVDTYSYRQNQPTSQSDTDYRRQLDTSHDLTQTRSVKSDGTGVMTEGSLTSSRSTSPFVVPAKYKPYKPVSSQEVYYIESGTEDGQSTATLTESTTESTHIGSDDAKAPRFPSSVLGSRPDNPPNTEGIYHKQKPDAEPVILSTIQEQPSFDSRDTDSGKSKSQDSAKTKISEEKEQSVLKVKDWVDGSFTSYSPQTGKHKDRVRESTDHEDRYGVDNIQPRRVIDDITSQVDRYLNSFHDKDGKASSDFSTPRKRYERRVQADGTSVNVQTILDRSSIYSQTGGMSQDEMQRDSLRMEMSRTDSDTKISNRFQPEIEKLVTSERSPDVPYQAVSPHYDSATQKINYGQLRYSQQTGKYELPPSFDASPAFESYNKGTKSSEEFLPLEADEDPDSDDVPGKSYPVTPHPHTAGIHKQMTESPAELKSPLSRLPMKYYFSDGRVIDRSPSASVQMQEQSFISDRLSTDRVNSPQYRQLSPPRIHQKVDSLHDIKPAATGRQSNYSCGGPETGNNLKLSQSRPTESPGVGQNCDNSLRYQVYSGDPYQMKTANSDALYPRQYNDAAYDEEKLAQKMRYVMAQLSPEADSLPPDINEKWDHFLEIRGRSNSSCSGSRSLTLDTSSTLMKDQSSSVTSKHYSSSPCDEKYKMDARSYGSYRDQLATCQGTSVTSSAYKPSLSSYNQNRDSMAGGTNRDTDSLYRDAKYQNDLCKRGSEYLSNPGSNYQEELLNSDKYHPSSDVNGVRREQETYSNEETVHTDAYSNEEGIHRDVYLKEHVHYKQSYNNEDNSKRERYITDTGHYRDQYSNGGSERRELYSNNAEHESNVNYSNSEMNYREVQPSGPDHSRYTYDEAISHGNNLYNNSFTHQNQSASRNTKEGSDLARNKVDYPQESSNTGLNNDPEMAGSRQKDYGQSGNRNNMNHSESRTTDPSCYVEYAQQTPEQHYAIRELKDIAVQVRTPDLMEAERFMYDEQDTEELLKPNLSQACQVNEVMSGQEDGEQEARALAVQNSQEVSQQVNIAQQESRSGHSHHQVTSEPEKMRDRNGEDNERMSQQTSGNQGQQNGKTCDGEPADGKTAAAAAAAADSNEKVSVGEQTAILISEQSSEQVNNATEPKKKAYLVKDETLPSVPEDTTLDSVSSDFTTSSYESDGKIIMKTTKRHLPDDPKLLRLQHKIMKQKEKYKHERLRELRRKEKIVRLERVLAEQNMVVTRNARTRASKANSDWQAAAPKKTSTPSGRDQVAVDTSSDSTLVTVSDITTSTVTPASTISEYQSDVRDSSMESVQPHVTCQSQITLDPRFCQTQATTQLKVIEYSGKQFSSTCSTYGQENIQLHLSFAQGRKRTGGLYMEFDKPVSAPQIRIRSDRGSEKNKENSDQLQQKRAQMKQKKDEHNLHKKKKISGRLPMTAAARKEPSMNSRSREVATQVDNDILQKSEAAQTQTPSSNSHFGTANSQRKDIGTHTSELTSNLQKSSRHKHKDVLELSRVRPGLAWFIPLEGNAPWRKPLHERQPHTACANFGSDGKMHSWSMDKNQWNSDLYRHSLMSSGRDGKLSLQEAFTAHKRDFISRSRERQRLVRLRSDERHIQELHRIQREQLFAVRNKLDANRNAHPLSEQHFKPQKRKFTRKEMVEQTKKLYSKLPEVTKQLEDEKRMKFYQTNRLRARLYKQRIQNQVLGKQAHWFS